MRYILLLLLFCAPVFGEVQEETTAVAGVLNDFHDAAAKADGKRYFAHFEEGAVFLGTDIKERWPLEDFKAYALPHFQKGHGWTYIPVSRHISLAPEGRTAWFDEILRNEKFGNARGSGVLIKTGNQWKLTQYNLTVPIPNELMTQVVKMIEDQAKTPVSP